MIYFDETGVPTVHTEKDAFRSRLFAVLRAASLPSFRWEESSSSAPMTVPQRRMLERLFLTYAAGAGAPGWITPFVQCSIVTRPVMVLRGAVRGVKVGPAAPQVGQGASPGGGGLHRGAAGGLCAPALPGIGAGQAGRVLLVGDRPGSGWGQYAPNWPFISANHGGASSWLARHLEEYEVSEAALFWVNAYDRDDVPLDVGRVHRMPFWSTTNTLIVSFGKHAHAWCEKNEVNAVQVHHPQYWMAKHPAETYRLGKILRQHLGS